jgi:hypothetical protein
VKCALEPRGSLLLASTAEQFSALKREPSPA